MIQRLFSSITVKHLTNIIKQTAFNDVLLYSKFLSIIKDFLGFDL